MDIQPHAEIHSSESPVYGLESVAFQPDSTQLAPICWCARCAEAETVFTLLRNVEAEGNLVLSKRLSKKKRILYRYNRVIGAVEKETGRCL